MICIYKCSVYECIYVIYEYACCVCLYFIVNSWFRISAYKVVLTLEYTLYDTHTLVYTHIYIRYIIQRIHYIYIIYRALTSPPPKTVARTVT